MTDKIEFVTTLIKNNAKTKFNDTVPSPFELNCKSYYYIEWIEVPENLRKQGMAKKLLINFCNKTKKPILIYLLSGVDFNGDKLKPLLERLNFKVINKAKFMIDMLRS